jgi:pathogenesis-related protein 1
MLTKRPRIGAPRYHRAMRAAAILLLLTTLTPALAQYPYGYPGYGQPYRQAPPPPTQTPYSYAADLLRAQNEVRMQVGVPPLVWSPRLAAAAQDWADGLIRTGRFAHTPDDPYGENLYEIDGGTASPDQVVGAWADEARDYDIRTNSCTSVCGHYTQIVWRATRGVGCAVAAAAEREVWVCEYDPPGNIIGYRPY